MMAPPRMPAAARALLPLALLATPLLLAGLMLAQATQADAVQPWQTYYEVRLEADGVQSKECDVGVEVALTPVDVPTPPPGSPYVVNPIVDHARITGRPIEDGPRNWECWFSYRSPLLAPGKWRISGEFLSGTQACVRDVRPGGPNRVRIDEGEGCVEYPSPSASPAPGAQRH
ncbi:MAG: hypothetical protein U1F11_03120 [Steroidobacteraceae bacterium]